MMIKSRKLLFQNLDRKQKEESISLAQQEYLKRCEKEKRMIQFWQWILMILFLTISFRLSYTSVLLGMVVAHVPYVILSVLPKLQQTSRNTYEAALDLGASPMKAFFKIVLPDIFPGVLSGFMLAFTLALDDFVITHFTKDAKVSTLSTVIYSETRRGIEPEIYALSTIMFTVVLVLLIVMNRMKASAAKKLAEQQK